MTFRFHDTHAHWWTETQLTDLCVALYGNRDLQVNYGMHSTYDPARPAITISTFWESLPEAERLLIQKTDVYLRAIGNTKWTNLPKMADAWRASATAQRPQLMRQLLCMAEDARLAARVVAQRPGTVNAFAARVSAYARLFANNAAQHAHAKKWADIVLGEVYACLGKLHTSTFSLDEVGMGHIEEAIRRFCAKIAVALETVDVIDATYAFLIEVSPQLGDAPDASYHLFSFDADSIQAVVDDAEHSVTGQVQKPQETCAQASPEERQEREQMEIWTQPQKTNAIGALSMDLQQAPTSPTFGGQVREADDDPDALETRRGHSQGGQREDVGEQDEQTSLHIGGAANEQASSVKDVIEIDRPPLTHQETEKVLVWQKEVQSSKAKLIKLFDQLWLHRMQAKQSDTRYGRLGKQLTRVLTDHSPRLFYHKSSKDKPFDAAVQLLVDCSGSMYEKLEPLKPLIYLFHDTFRQLQLAHSITGFWEDTVDTTLMAQSKGMTHLLHVVTWQEAAAQNAAGYIDRLTPQLDNRDGYAIRHVGQRLLRRPERQKWLLVISDGEPAAEDYRDAIVDTKNAVRWLTKNGAHVLHICLTDAADEQQATRIRQIYGTGAVIVPGLDRLASALENVFLTLLKRTANI